MNAEYEKNEGADTLAQESSQSNGSNGGGYSGASMSGDNAGGSSESSGSDSSSVPGSTQPVTTQVREAVGSVIAPAQQKTGEIISQVQQQAVSRLDQQKDHAAGGLSAVAESLRETGQQLRDKDQGVVAQYASQYTEAAAGQVEKVSGYLQGRDVNQLISEVEDFARREPAIFVAGAFLLGLASARFLRVPAASANTSGALASPSSGSGNAYGSAYNSSGYGSSSGYDSSSGYGSSSGSSSSYGSSSLQGTGSSDE